MATNVPLSIEAPKPDSHRAQSEIIPHHDSVVPSKEASDTVIPQASASKFNSGKKKIPDSRAPGAYHVALKEQQTRHENTQIKLEAEAIGTNALHLKGTRSQTRLVKHEKTARVRDNQGNMIQIKRTVTELEIYIEIFEILYVEAREDTKGIEADPNCGEKTIDLCCQSLVCHFDNPFKENAPLPVEKKQLMNPTRRRGRAKGWTILKGLIFPFVSDITRDFWVFFQLLFVLTLFCLSASTFALAGENYEVFHAVHLGFSVLAAFLAMLDCIVSFTQCSTCRACISCCQEIANRNKDSEGNETADKKKIDDTATTSNANIDEEAATGTYENEQENALTSVGDTTKCNKCFMASKSSIDIARVFLTEFILIPIIFCDMFEVATGKGFNSDVLYHRIGFALMVYDCIGLIIFVFLLRLVILSRIIYSEQRMHPTPEDVQLINKEQGTTQQNINLKDYNLDGSIKKNSLKIQIVFILHVFGQIIAHILMLVAVGAKIAYDTRNYGTRNADSLATGFLWYMMVATYVLPTVGIGTFFIVYNYWVQQFLIGLCIDFVKLLQIGEDFNPVASSGEKRSETISKFVGMTNPLSNLPTEYEDMRHEVNIVEKLFYPFGSPSHIILCVLYFLSHFAFLLCCGFTLDDAGRLDVVFLNEGDNWLWYLLSAAFIGAVMNIYSFLVAGLWIMFVLVVTVNLFLLVIVGTICLCCCYKDAHSDD